MTTRTTNGTTSQPPKKKLKMTIGTISATLKERILNRERLPNRNPRKLERNKTVNLGSTVALSKCPTNISTTCIRQRYKKKNEVQKFSQSVKKQSKKAQKVSESMKKQSKKEQKLVVQSVQ